MRWFHLSIIVIFALAIIIFALQNLEPVTIAFLGFSLRAPLAIIVVVIYLLGMATGSTLLHVLRKSVSAARGHGPGATGS